MVGAITRSSSKIHLAISMAALLHEPAVSINNEFTALAKFVCKILIKSGLSAEPEVYIFPKNRPHVEALRPQ